MTKKFRHSKNTHSIRLETEEIVHFVLHWMVHKKTEHCPVSNVSD